MKFSLRLLYLYLFSFVGLLIVVIAGINLINLGLKVFVFREADVYEFYGPQIDKEGREAETPEQMKNRQVRETGRQRQRDLSNALAMLSVGAPLYLYHWRLIEKEGRN